MGGRSIGVRWALLGALAAGQVAWTGATARAAGQGRGGHAARAPRGPSPRQAVRAPRMPRAPAPAHANAARNRTASPHRGSPHPGGTATLANNAAAATKPHRNRSAGAAGSPLTPGAPRNLAGTPSKTRNAGGGVVPPTAAANARGRLSGRSPSYQYTYGHGAGARPYRAYGYGRGYRNRYYHGGYGYGRSQGFNRGIVARLRSVHARLARLDRDYQGHRVRAMHAIAMAIRQLSHQSMVYTGQGLALGMGRRASTGQGGRRSALAGGGGRGGRPMPQAQSDARMSQALRELQGIGMQLGNQGQATTGHARAMGHIQRAIHELNGALSIR